MSSHRGMIPRRLTLPSRSRMPHALLECRCRSRSGSCSRISSTGGRRPHRFGKAVLRGAIRSCSSGLFGAVAIPTSAECVEKYLKDHPDDRVAAMSVLRNIPRGHRRRGDNVQHLVHMAWTLGGRGPAPRGRAELRQCCVVSVSPPWSRPPRQLLLGSQPPRQVTRRPMKKRARRRQNLSSARCPIWLAYHSQALGKNVGEGRDHHCRGLPL